MSKEVLVDRSSSILVKVGLTHQLCLILLSQNVLLQQNSRNQGGGERTHYTGQMHDLRSQHDR